MADPIGADDLDAYVDDELVPERRVEVTAYLASHPDAAAQVFADIHARSALKLALAGPAAEPAPHLVAAARRLERRLHMRDLRQWAARAAAVAGLIGLGWYAHWQAGAFTIPDNDEAPAFVVDAVHAYRTHLARAQARMNDAEEVFSRTRIAMPRLKDDWRLADVQTYPSPAGSSIEATLIAGALGQLSLFASRTGQDHSIQPTVSRSSHETTVYWQRGSTFYALTGNRPEKVMRSIADTLMKG
ncbi:MAG: anti-sigma factor [Pseudomonadota bacterium]|jgi:anti-sigma factor RsiW